MAAVPRNIEETLTLLRQGNYIADRSLATAVFLSLKLKRPLFLEGEAGAPAMLRRARRRQRGL